MTNIHFDLAGPTLVCGFAISVPVLAAAVAFAWRYWRRSRQEDPVEQRTE